MEIAAGARIQQQIYKDLKTLDFWEPNPTSILYVNYADTNQVKTILSQKRIGSQTEKPLAGLTVKNP